MSGPWEPVRGTGLLQGPLYGFSVHPHTGFRGRHTDMGHQTLGWTQSVVHRGSALQTGDPGGNGPPGTRDLGRAGDSSHWGSSGRSVAGTGFSRHGLRGVGRALGPAMH